MPARINHKKCNLCGKCIFMCGSYVFELKLDPDRVHPVRARDCIDCFVCSEVCPKNAINIKVRRR